MRDKSTLEYEEKMCVHCCNFDKEHIGMDGTAFCKLTMTLAYAEDCGGNCMFYNVPKEQIIVPPCKVGDIVYTSVRMQGWYYRDKDKPYSAKIVFIGLNNSEEMGGGLFNVVYEKDGNMLQFRFSDIGKTVFLTKEEAEQALKEREKV